MFGGTAEKRVIPGDGAGEFLPGTFMTVTLSCDHRVVDGELSTLLLLVIAGHIWVWKAIFKERLFVV